MSVVAHLWLPIVLSAAAVFVLSAASHMVLPWRRGSGHAGRPPRRGFSATITFRTVRPTSSPTPHLIDMPP